MPATRNSVDEKLERLQSILGDMEEGVLAEFQERLDMSWIYHDSALEGVVLTFHELKSAIDKDVVSDVSLIPTYDEIRAHKATIDFVRELAGQRKRVPLNVELLLKLREVLCPEPVALAPAPVPVPLVPPPPLVPAMPPGVTVHQPLEAAPAAPTAPPAPPAAPAKDTPWRKDNPVHRLYFHDIPPADKIPAEMKKLEEWLKEPETKKLSAIRLATRVHLKLMQIYPFPKHSGKIARLAMNFVLLRAGYPPAIIHSTERQRYYETLRGPSIGLYNLVLDSVENSIDSAIKLFSESRSGRRALM